MIRSLSFVMGSIVLAGLLVGCQSASQFNSPQDVAQLSAAKQSFFDCWTKEKGQTFTTEKLVKVVDPSTDFLSFDGMCESNTVIQGSKTYTDIWGPGMNGFVTAKLSESSAIRTWVQGDLGLTASIAHIQGELPDGNKLDMQGHLTLGWKRENGQWRLIHEHMSLGVKQPVEKK